MGLSPTPAPNAGWSVGRFRRMVRWVVYACTIVMVLLCIASYWPQPRWSREYVPSNGSIGNRTYTEVILSDGLINIERYPDYQQMGFSAPTPGVYHHFDWRSQKNPSSHQALSASSYITKGGGSSGPFTRYRFRSLWPAVILVGISLVLWYRERLNPTPGCCSSCGYSLEGLVSNTCPECGVERG